MGRASAARLEVPRGPLRAKALKFRLLCERHWRRKGYESEAVTALHEAWLTPVTVSFEDKVSSATRPPAVALPLNIDVPAGLPPTTMPGTYEDGEESAFRTVWKLEAKAKTRGVDFAVSFELPVFGVA